MPALARPATAPTAAAFVRGITRPERTKVARLLSSASVAEGREIPPIAPLPYRTLPPPALTSTDVALATEMALKSVWPLNAELMLIPFQTTAVCCAVVPLNAGDATMPKPFSLK